ncbi:hypothetical protein RN001_013012 [Aquatica leii]|uniref:Protein sleepless n=1 Tax=Aquatica leii TaxID=1421715 RepID=A0AAN7PR60_9COLE|nr:hypothetical protein RN001_013012 [Aquatica leii]
MEVSVKNSFICCCFLFLTLAKMGQCNPRCYVCDTMSNPNCIQPRDHKMETKECTPGNVGEMKVAVEKLGVMQLANFFDMEIDRSDFSVPLQCVKTVIKDNDKEMIVRGCQLAPKDNLDVCKKIKEEREDIVTHCSFCNENGCNSTSFLQTSMALIFLLLPVLKAF